MPFIYREKPANINRSSKRDDSFIHENVVRAFGEVSSRGMAGIAKILPIYTTDAPFEKNDPNEFLALYCTKLGGLSMYEVEHWLDNIACYEMGFVLDRGISSVLVDQRKKYYKSNSSPIIKNYVYRIS
jgi:hypothetical protein